MASSSSYLASSSSSYLASHPLKYYVFLNFRGEDTRRNFICHLYDALRRSNILTFYDDDGIERGEHLAQSLPRAIQVSTIAVLVFSKDYASSSWCLDELAEIIDCHRSHGQIIIPAFYNIDPSHLRKQLDGVAVAFYKHEQDPNKAHKIQRWKEALTRAASLSGFDSRNFRNDRVLINVIVTDILKKLNHLMKCDDIGHLVGMEVRIEEIKKKKKVFTIGEVKKVFTIDPSKNHILEIWGMAGAGKTTIAEVIYKMMSRQFQDCCFVYNVRQQAEASGINKLQDELISKILGGNYTFNVSFEPRLSQKKVLIVLDDVNNPQQIESLIGDPCWFGSGSMILITSRNRQVFNGRADFIYEVKLLNHDEALQLFNKKAFKQNYPRDDYESLSESIVEYAQGNPLALKVLGSALNGKNHQEWKSALTQLSKVQNEDIQQVLQISYDGLTRVEKDVFLDIACFFKHVGQVYVKEDILKKIYKSSEFGIDITLSVLIDKCLLTSKYPWNLNMHDLLQEMGKEIVRRENRYSYQRSRLWDPQDIYEIFAENMVAEAVETITLDLSKIREINLNPQVFMKMPNLRFLNFYGESNLRLFYGLDYLPNTLQYLRWNKYPLKSFPLNFQPKKLVVLELPNSNIKQLWNRAKEDCLVSQLIHWIVNGFRRLTSLSLVQNKSITQLPNDSSGFLEALEVLDLRGCSNLNTFPEISSNLKQLNLNKTAIRQIPSSSVERLNKLQYLRMEDCRKLESLPSNFFSKLTSLSELDLSGCSRFKLLPEILEPMRHLVFLSLSETAIEELPSFIGNFNGSWRINMSKCSKLAFYPRSSKNCFPKDIFWTGYLNLSNCNLRELPEDLSILSFVDSLDLSENDFQRIPATFKQLSLLNFLYINDCERLLSLSELPLNVYIISARRCRSLKEIWTLRQLPLDSLLEDYAFDFRNCLKLDEVECHEVVNALLRNYTRTQMQESLVSFEMVYPGIRIPQWVKYQNMGDSIQILLPSHWFNHRFLGFAFYLYVENILKRLEVITYHCWFGDDYQFSSDHSEPLYVGEEDNEHAVVFINKRFSEWVRRHSDFEEGVAFFKFTADGKEIIKKSGIIPLYEFSETFDFPNLGGSKLKRSATGAGSSHCMPEKRLKIEDRRN